VVEQTQPSTKDIIVWDVDVTGFGLKVTPPGKKSFFVQYRTLDHIERKLKIGDCSSWKPDEARDFARDVHTEVRKGNDPSLLRQTKRASRGENTVQQWFEDYLAFKKKQGRKSTRQIEQVFNHNILPVLGKRRVDEVTRSDITKLLDGIAERSISVAGGTRRQLSAFYNWAIPRLPDGVSNPVTNAGRPPAVKARKRHLSDAELIKLWTVLEGEREPWRTALRLMILTAQRRNEVLLADWKEFDLAKKIWTVPSERAKNGKANLVPLSGPVLKLLKALPGRSGRLFPKGTGLTGRAAKRIREAVGAVEPWRWHDLRRTAATGMQRNGVQQPVTEAVLNHVSGSQAGIVGVYQVHDWAKEKREALDEWAAYVIRITAKQRKKAA
jgi:integrase